MNHPASIDPDSTIVTSLRRQVAQSRFAGSRVVHVEIVPNKTSGSATSVIK